MLTAGVGGPAYAAANLVTNGSFETGDFSGWTQVRNTGLSGVFCPGAGSVPRHTDAIQRDQSGGDAIHPSFDTRATGASTALTFNFRDDPAFLHLDAVSVSVPEPGTLPLLGIGFAGVWAGRRRRAK